MNLKTIPNILFVIHEIGYETVFCREEFQKRESRPHKENQSNYRGEYMKDMKYDLNISKEIIDEGNFDGFNYAIINFGSHPGAYVQIPLNHPYFKKGYDEMDIEVHGGLTYSDSSHWSTNDGYWIGWDYAHSNDFMPLVPSLKDGKKWTTEEIFEDVKKVVNQLKTKKFILKKIYFWIRNWTNRK